MKPQTGDAFIVKRKYSFNPVGFKKNQRAIIDVEIYEHQICEISFYSKSNRLSDYKYEHRLNCGTGYALSILRACLQIYLDLQNVEALTFTASNDLNSIKNYNDRYRTYLKVIENYIPNFGNYYQTGSIKLNTYMIYPMDYKHKAAAKIFFENYETLVAENLEARIKRLSDENER